MPFLQIYTQNIVISINILLKYCYLLENICQHLAMFYSNGVYTTIHKTVTNSLKGKQNDDCNIINNRNNNSTHSTLFSTIIVKIKFHRDYNHYKTTTIITIFITTTRVPSLVVQAKEVVLTGCIHKTGKPIN